MKKVVNEEKEILKEENPENVSDSEKEETAEEKTSPETESPAGEPLPNVEELQAKIAELEDQLLRKIAEFDNYRRRTNREKDEIGLTARIKCVGELLPVLDNFERALKIGCADEEFLKGVKLIFNTMTAAFTKMGVEEIPAEGKTFDPELHYAVARVENPDLGENAVAAVVQKGYQMSGKVIRHAMVSVANAD